MATTTMVDGTLIKLYKATTAFAKLKSNDMSIAIDKLVTSNKDDAGWETSLAGLKSGSFSFEGNFIETGGSTNTTFDELLTDAAAGTIFTANMHSGVSGDSKFSASVFLTDLKLNAPFNDIVTFSGTLNITGALTASTVS